MSLMGTPKPLQITVALPSASAQSPILRKWIYKEDEDLGYRYLESREVQGKPNTLYLFSETANALLSLVNPARDFTAEEIKKWGDEAKGFTIKDNLEPNEVQDFLNRYGQIGRADYARREKFSRAFTPDGGELTAQQFAQLCDINPLLVPNIEKFRKQNKDDWRKRILRIQWGLEIPFSWIQKDLFALASTVRILASLEKHWESGNPIYYLKPIRSKALRAFLLASERVSVPFGKDEDYKPLDTKWSISEKIIESDWEKFASNLNRFISPITRNLVSTDKRDQIALDNVGIETYLIFSILQTTAQFAEKRCANPNCNKQFFFERSTKTYCEESCQTTARVKRWRANKKKKNSSAKGQKKKQTKGRKPNG